MTDDVTICTISPIVPTISGIFIFIFVVKATSSLMLFSLICCWPMSLWHSSCEISVNVDWWGETDPWEEYVPWYVSRNRWGTWRRIMYTMFDDEPFVGAFFTGTNVMVIAQFITYNFQFVEVLTDWELILLNLHQVKLKLEDLRAIGLLESILEVIPYLINGVGIQ